MGNGAAPTNGKAAARPAGNLGVFPTVDAAVEAAEAAFEQFRRRGLSDRKKAVECIRKICVDQAEELGRLELEETKIGRLDHKIAKLDDDDPADPRRRVPADRQRQRRRRPDADRLHARSASSARSRRSPTACRPWPANAINMLAAGNTVVFNAHPSGGEDRRRGRPPLQQGDPRGDRPREPADDHRPADAQDGRPALRSTKAIKLLVVTGGPAVARAALASKRRAIVAGPGNPPVVVDATACLDNAAKSIVVGGAFDNNLLCIGEKQVFAVAEIFDSLTEAMTRHGGYRLTAGQIEALTKAAFQSGSDGKLHVNKDLIGKDPAVLAEHAGRQAARRASQLLFGETGSEHPFVQRRADDALRPVRAGLERRSRHRPGQGERARLRPHRRSSTRATRRSCRRWARSWTARSS